VEGGLQHEVVMVVVVVVVIMINQQ